MLVFSVLIISRLDSQSKFQMFTLFFGRHIGVPRMLWRKVLKNILMNICSLRQRSGLKLGEVSYLVISYNIKILSLFHWTVFDISFLLRDNENYLYI